MALSEQWRMTGSTIQEVDIAQVVRSLRDIVINLLGYEVEIIPGRSGMTYTDEKTIVVGVGEFLDKPNPLPPEIVDVLVGKIIHEAEHIRQESLKYKVSGKLGEYAEELFVDTQIRKRSTRLAEYLDTARKQYVPTFTPDRLGGLENMFLANVVYDINVDQLIETHLDPFEKLCWPILMALKAQLKICTPDQRTALIQKAIDAINAILRQRNELSNKIVANVLNNASGPKFPGNKSQDVQSQTQTRQEQQTQIQNQLKAAGIEPKQIEAPKNETICLGATPQNQTDETDETNETTDEIVNLLTKVNEALNLDTQDITHQLQQLGVDTGRPVIWKKATGTPMTSHNRELERDLLWFKYYKNTMSKVRAKAQETGRIDTTNIWRYKRDGRIFQQRKTRTFMKRDVVLLLDKSGSMERRTSIYEAAHALKKIDPSVVVLGYSAEDTIVIEDLNLGETLIKPRPDGLTPTGLAVLATSLRYPKATVIVFTDGHENKGPSLSSILDKTPFEFKIINVVLSTRHNLYREPAQQRNMTTVYINSVGEFPGVLLGVLRPIMMSQS